MRTYILAQTKGKYGTPNFEIDMQLFLKKEKLQAALDEQVKNAMQQPDTHSLRYGAYGISAETKDGILTWTVQEQDIPAGVVIHVSEGLVQSVYTNAEGLYPEVIDTDNDDGDREHEVEAAMERIQAIEENPDWKDVL